MAVVCIFKNKNCAFFFFTNEIKTNQQQRTKKKSVEKIITLTGWNKLFIYLYLYTIPKTKNNKKIKNFTIIRSPQICCCYWVVFFFNRLRWIQVQSSLIKIIDLNSIFVNPTHTVDANKYLPLCLCIHKTLLQTK